MFAPILDTFTHGPLRVYLDADTGAFVAVLDIVTGCAAEGLYRPAFIAQAKTAARAQWECTQDR